MKRPVLATLAALALTAGDAHARTPTKFDRAICQEYGSIAQRALDLERADRSGAIDQGAYIRERQALMQQASRPPYWHLLMQAVGSPLETAPWIADVTDQYERACIQRVTLDAVPRWPDDPARPAPRPCEGANVPAACFKDDLPR